MRVAKGEQACIPKISGREQERVLAAMLLAPFLALSRYQGDLQVAERSLKWPCHAERSEESVQVGERDSSLRSE